MKHIPQTAPIIALVLFSFFIQSGHAGETLADVKFATLDLDKLPEDWSLSERGTVSMVDDDKRGHKVLKFTTTYDGKTEKFPQVSALFLAAPILGKTVKFTTWVKFPAAFIPIADNTSAVPQVSIDFNDAAAKPIEGAKKVRNCQAGQAEWTELSISAPVPENAGTCIFKFAVPIVACEIFFDGLTLTAEAAPPAPDPVVAAAPPPEAQPAVPAPPPPPPPPAADPDTPASMAAKAPKRSFDDGGMLFGPEMAAALQKNIDSKKGALVNTVMFVGAGYTEKSALPKLSSPWRAIPISPKLVGHTAGAPRSLLSNLPEVLVKEKPEVVFVAGDFTPGRKRTQTDSDDWDDVARLCVRLGALPVLVPFVPEGKEPIKDENFDNALQAFRKAGDMGSYVMVSGTPVDAFPKRADNLLKLFDIHVFARVKQAEAGKPVIRTGKTVEE